MSAAVSAGSCDVDELVSRGPGHQQHVGHAHRDLDLAVRVRRVQLDGGQLLDAGPGARRVAGQRLAPGVLGERLLEDRRDAQAACLRHCPDSELRGLAEPADTFEAARERVQRDDMVTTGRQVRVHGNGSRVQVEARVGLAQPAADVSGPQQDRRGVLRCGILRDLQSLAHQRDGGGEVEPLDGIDGRDVHPGAGEWGVAGLVELVRPEGEDASPLGRCRLDGVARPTPLGPRRCASGAPCRGHLLRPSAVRSPRPADPARRPAPWPPVGAPPEPRPGPGAGGSRRPRADAGAGPRAVGRGEQPLRVELAQPGDGVERR